MINVAVADKECVTAQAVGRCIDDESDMQVTKIYADADRLIGSPEMDEADVIVIDPDGLSGTPSDLVWRVRMSHPDVQIVVLTASQRERNLFAAVRAGVRGFVSKYADITEVVKAIRAVYRGDSQLSQEGAAQIMDEFSRRSREETGLTQRQREVLRGIVQGKSNREIARDLDLTEKTIKNYVAAIFPILGARARTEAAIIALQEGLVSEKEWRETDVSIAS
ncbi:MAG: response regulator transcription factor [Chloroflexota bacterium]